MIVSKTFLKSSFNTVMIQNLVSVIKKEFCITYKIQQVCVIMSTCVKKNQTTVNQNNF